MRERPFYLAIPVGLQTETQTDKEPAVDAWPIRERLAKAKSLNVRKTASSLRLQEPQRKQAQKLIVF